MTTKPKPKKKKIKESCPEFPYFGAKYPDARCIDGQLYDLDRCDERGRLYEMHEYHPCPFCNTQRFIKQWEDDGHLKEEILKWIEETKSKYSR